MSSCRCERSEGVAVVAPAKVFELDRAIQDAPESVVSREILRGSGGGVTLFAFDAGQELSEHTTPHDALVQVLEGEMDVSIAACELRVKTGQAVIMPSDVPHALRAPVPAKMMLVMLRPKSTGSDPHDHPEED